jgi:hypothetical protein
MKLTQQAPHSITPSRHYSISHGGNTHLALLQNATAHVLANSAIGSGEAEAKRLPSAKYRLRFMRMREHPIQIHDRESELGACLVRFVPPNTA